MCAFNISLLPQELLILIMSQVDSLRQLKECSLVCKAWSNPALMNMLGREISLKTENSALRLHDILARQPSNGHLIKHLSFDSASVRHSLILKQLIRLALTPTIETIKGMNFDDDFFTEFNDIMATWPQGFKKLRVMPEPRVISTAYITALTSTKGSLEEIAPIFIPRDQPDTHMRNLILQLPQFPKLASLELLMYRLEDLRYLNTVLNCFPYIRNLYLAVRYRSVENAMEFSNVTDWIESSVEQQQHLKSLWIDTICSQQHLQYLLRKYPNIEKVEINVLSYGDQAEIDLKRMIDLIGNDLSKRIVVTVDLDANFHAIMHCLLVEYNYKIKAGFDDSDLLKISLYRND